MKPIKNFIFEVLRTLKPRYYGRFAEKDYWDAGKFFLKMLLAAFIIMSLLAIPKILFIYSDMQKSSLEIAQFRVTMAFETLKPISIPGYAPIVTLDTTGNSSLDDQYALITNEEITVKMFGTEKSMPVNTFEFTENREFGLNTVLGVIVFLLPGLFVWYYFIYLVKYLIILIPFALISFVFSKIFNNSVTLKQAIVLSLYTSTGMILLEVLTLPFFISKYLISYTPIIGVNFSVIGITLYLVFYVAAIRLSGSKKIE